MQLSYLKMHGTGNQILVIDQRGTEVDVPAADIMPATDADATAAYRVFNADGSEVEQCGNGLRCVAWWLSREGPETLVLQSPAGRVDARVLEDARVSVSTGAPEFEPPRIPFDAAARADRYTIDVDGDAIDAAVLSMGNPHCVLTVDNVAEAPVGRLGALLESHERFPQKTNVGFMQVLDASRIALRVFERGVGETAACGTGACAAVVAGVLNGDLERDVTVRVPGGELVVSWQPDAVWLTGQVELINEGSIEL